jgi:hypothetical protein
MKILTVAKTGTTPDTHKKFYTYKYRKMNTNTAQSIIGYNTLFKLLTEKDDKKTTIKKNSDISILEGNQKNQHSIWIKVWRRRHRNIWFKALMSVTIQAVHRTHILPTKIHTRVSQATLTSKLLLRQII